MKSQIGYTWLAENIPQETREIEYLASNVGDGCIMWDILQRWECYVWEATKHNILHWQFGSSAEKESQ